MDTNGMFRLDGTVALVTGASSGLGWGFAKTLARAELAWRSRHVASIA